MRDELLRVPVDAETLDRLRERALAERRGTADEAAIILQRVLARTVRRQRTVEPTAEPER